MSTALPWGTLNLLEEFARCPLCGSVPHDADGRRRHIANMRIRYKCDAVFDLWFKLGGLKEHRQLVRCTRDAAACLGEGI